MTEINVPENGEKLMAAMRALINFSQPITEKMIEKHGGRWSDGDQIARMHEEVSEVYRALRKGQTRHEMIEEICDCIMASLTMANLEDVTPAELAAAASRTMYKLYHRVGFLE